LPGFGLELFFLLFSYILLSLFYIFSVDFFLDLILIFFKINFYNLSSRRNSSPRARCEGSAQPAPADHMPSDEEDSVKIGVRIFQAKKKRFFHLGVDFWMWFG